MLKLILELLKEAGEQKKNATACHKPWRFFAEWILF